MKYGLSEKDRLRFEAKVDRSGGHDACHPWFASKTIGRRGAYGKFAVGRRILRANRIALEQKLGRPLRPGMMALHTCDNPPCVNEAHLYEGTPAQNNHDRVTRKPNSWPSGSRCPSAFFSAEEVREMRAEHAAGKGPRAIAKSRGLNFKTVCGIVYRKRYVSES